MTGIKIEGWGRIMSCAQRLPFAATTGDALHPQGNEISADTHHTVPTPGSCQNKKHSCSEI